jgi:ribosomal protein S18 acetylase RimI-like enzyme
MEPDLTPLFCDKRLAARVEHAESRLIAEAARAANRRQAGGAGFVMPIAGGFATFAEPGSPFNKVAGLGFAGVPSALDLDEIEQAFAESGADVQIELSHLGDSRIGSMLSDRGYRLTSFENVSGRALDGVIEPVTPQGVEVRRTGEAEFDAWLDVVADAFAHPDTQGVPSHEEFPRDVLARAERDFAAAGVVRYLALRDGVPAAGASLRTGEGVAQMTGSATAPAHRRRGIQSALIATRLADAAAAGCDIAVVTTQPGSESQHNVQRRGFHLLYTRAVLVKATASR